MNKENIKNIYFNNFKIKALYSGENLIFRSDLIEKNIYEYSLIPSEENFSLEFIPDIFYNNLEVPIVLKISAINKPDILLEGKKSSFSINIFEGYKIEDIRKIEIKYDKADFISNTSKLKYNLEYVYNIDISLSKNIDSLFSNCVNLKKIPSIDISEVDSLNNLFYNCINMQGYADPDKYWNLRKDLDDSKHEYCFYNCKMLSNYEEIPMSWNGFDYENEYKDCLVCYTFDSSKESNYSFSGITHLPHFDFMTDNTKYSVEDEDLGNNLIRRKIKTEYPCERVTFNGNKSVVSVEYLNTDNMTSLYYAFAQCPLLEKVDLSLSNTTKLKDMSYCFSNSDNLKEINLININVENVTNMQCMFNGCIMLSKLNIDNWKTSSLTNTSYMFANCKSLKEIDISHFDTKNVDIAIYMFEGCSNTNIINMINFMTGSLTIKGVSLMFIGVPSSCLVYVGSNFLYSENDCGFKGKFIRYGVKDIAIVDGDYPDGIESWGIKGVYFLKDEENLLHIKSKEALENYERLLREKTVFYYDLSNIVNLKELFVNSKLTEKNIIIDLDNRIIDKDFTWAFYGIEYYNKNSSSTLINSFKLLNLNFDSSSSNTINLKYAFRASNIENIDLSEIVSNKNVKFKFNLGGCFSDCINLKRVDLSNIEYIEGYEAFYNCPSLEYLNLSNIKEFVYTREYSKNNFSSFNRNCEILLNKNFNITEDMLGFKGFFKRLGSKEVCKCKIYVYKKYLEDPNYSYCNFFKGLLVEVSERFDQYYKYLNSPIQFEIKRNEQQTITNSEGKIEELIEVTISSYNKDCLNYYVDYEYIDKVYISDRNYPEESKYFKFFIKLIDDLYFLTNKINNENFRLESNGYINNVHIEDKLDLTSVSDTIKIVGIKNYFDFNNKLILPKKTFKSLYLEEINCEYFNLSNIRFSSSSNIANCPSLKSINFSGSIGGRENYIENNLNLENIDISDSIGYNIYIKNNINLKSIDFSYSKFKDGDTNEGIRIENNTNLKSIDFSNSFIGDYIFIENNLNLENINFTNVINASSFFNPNNLDLFHLTITGELIKELDLTFIDLRGRVHENFYDIIYKKATINLSGISKDCIVKVRKDFGLTEEECGFKGTFTRV